jgi:DNA-binding IclR family transcriptional regulator
LSWGDTMKSGSTEPAGYQAPAVQKAFQLLKAVADSRRELKLSELSKRLGFGKGTTHGLIQALLKTQALDQHPENKTYSLGPAVVDLAFKSWNYFRIVEQAQPVIEELRDATGETVFLGILTQSRGIIIASAEALKAIKISSPSGTSIPLLAGAVGKIFLADLDDEAALSLVRERGLRSYTPNAITDETAYLSELGRVRQQGYALDDEEYLPGVKAVAVSLGSHRGLSLAVWVVGFSNALDDHAMPEIIRSVQGAADKLKRMLIS